MESLFKLYEFIKHENPTPTTILFVTFVVIGALVAQLYVTSPPK